MSRIWGAHAARVSVSKPGRRFGPPQQNLRADFWSDIRVILNSLNVFLPRFGMEDVRFHRSVIFAISSDTCSPGTP